MASLWGETGEDAGHAPSAPRGVEPPCVTSGSQPGDTLEPSQPYLAVGATCGSMAGRPKVRAGAVPCATPGTWSRGQGPLWHRYGSWMPVDVLCRCSCVVPSVLAVCPAAPWWVPGPCKHPHLAPASLGHLGHLGLVTLLVPLPTPVPHQFQTPKKQAYPLPQAPGHPFHRYQQ